jgi:hypothetical protein
MKYGFWAIEEGSEVGSKRHIPEEIVTKRRQIDVLASQSQSVAEAIRSRGVTD